jgi:hypothetical protein
MKGFGGADKSADRKFGLVKRLGMDMRRARNDIIPETFTIFHLQSNRSETGDTNLQHRSHCHKEAKR